MNERSHIVLVGPVAGVVGVIASWFIAIGGIRRSAEDLGVKLPPTTTLLIDHGGTITLVAVILALVAMVVIEFLSSEAPRLMLSLVVTLILFGLTIWDFVIVWMLYTNTIQGLS